MVGFASCKPADALVLFVCLSVSNFAQKLPNGFAWNFQGTFAMGQWTNDQILVAIQITIWIQGLFSRFVTIGRYGKCLTDMNLLLILIRQMAALIRCTLAEVCTVPVLLVICDSECKFDVAAYILLKAHTKDSCLFMREHSVGGRHKEMKWYFKICDFFSKVNVKAIVLILQRLLVGGALY